MKVMFINSTAISGSHGRIIGLLGDMLHKENHVCYIAYGRGNYNGDLNSLRISSKADQAFHLLLTRFADYHGFGSELATKRFINKLVKIDPDIIHLHNIHGYYLNIRVLFDYLKERHKPVVWTLHDCWPFTGHCSHFESLKCDRWKTGCYKCPAIHHYPKSWFFDNSEWNYARKKELFNGVERMILVSPSQWLADHLGRSFLSGYGVRVLNNGIDTARFRPTGDNAVRSQYDIHGRYILGVANVWTQGKGLVDFIRLRRVLDNEITIVLVGLTARQIRTLPHGIKGIPLTGSIEELAALYSGAEVFLNPTYADNFPSVNLEAMACGTPVITYDTGGSPEAIDSNTGIVVEKGSADSLNEAVLTVINSADRFTPQLCRERAAAIYSADKIYQQYIGLYEEILNRAGKN